MYRACNYERGDDARVMHVLSHPEYMTYEVMSSDWTPTKACESLCKAMRVLMSAGKKILRSSHAIFPYPEKGIFNITINLANDHGFDVFILFVQRDVRKN